MKPLSKGDHVKVRVHTGEVVEAVYDCPCTYVKKHHWVLINGFSKVMGSFCGSSAECQLIGPACDLVPVGMSV